MSDDDDIEETDSNEAEVESKTEAAETPDLSTSADDRTTARVNLDRPMLIRLSSGDTVKARLVNLSCGGLAFEYPTTAERGITLTIMFQISSEAGPINIQAEGTVKHTHVKQESYVTGMQFTKISEEDVDVIEEFVEFKTSNASQLTGFAVSHRHRG